MDCYCFRECGKSRPWTKGLGQIEELRTSLANMPDTDGNPIFELGAAASGDAFLCANGAGTLVLSTSLIPLYRGMGDREGLCLAGETALIKRGI